MSRRERVAEAIKQEVSLIIHNKLKDPRVGFVTITRVEMAPDLRFAKIYFSVLGKDKEYRKTREALDSGAGFIRKLIAENINLRYAPEIAFEEDRSTEYSVRIQEVLNEIKVPEGTQAIESVKEEDAGKEKPRGNKKSRRTAKKA